MLSYGARQLRVLAPIRNANRTCKHKTAHRSLMGFERPSANIQRATLISNVQSSGQCLCGSGSGSSEKAPPRRWFCGCSSIKPLLRHEQQVRKLWQRELERVVMLKQDKAVKWLAVLEQIGRRHCMRSLYPDTRNTAPQLHVCYLQKH